MIWAKTTICSTIFLQFLLFGAIKADAQLKGSVVDSDGKPVTGILVELIPVTLLERPDPHDVWSEPTDANGAFLFQDVRSGPYFLAINYAWSPNNEHPFATTFYPNFPSKQLAEPIFFSSVAESNVVIRLSDRLRQLTVEGRILGVDGKPAADVHVRLENEERQPTLPVSDCRTDVRGNFVLKGFVGGRYHVSASNWSILSKVHDVAESESFSLVEAKTGIRLRLAPFKLEEEK